MGEGELAEARGPRALDGLVMADRCPFHRGFSDDFQGCPAFVPSEYVTVDFQFHATRPVWTCRYLQVGDVGSGEYYPACGLGGADKRADWVRRVKADRLELFRELQLVLAEAIRPHVLELLDAKARRLARGERLHPEDDGEVGELVRLAMVQVDVVLNLRRLELRQLGVPIEPCRDLIEWVLLEVGRRDDFAFPAISEQQLAGMPPDVADLLLAFRG